MESIRRGEPLLLYPSNGGHALRVEALRGKNLIVAGSKLNPGFYVKDDIIGLMEYLRVHFEDVHQQIGKV